MPPRLVGLLTVTGLRQVNALCDSGAQGSESSTNPVGCERSSPSLRAFSGLWGFPSSAACTRPATASPPWRPDPSAHTHQLTSHPLSDWNGLNTHTIVSLAFLTSPSLVLSWPGCFLAKSRITSGVLKAWLMAAWIAWKAQERWQELLFK